MNDDNREGPDGPELEPESESRLVYLRFRRVFGDGSSRSSDARKRSRKDPGASVPFSAGRDPQSLSSVVDALTVKLGWNSPLAKSELLASWSELAGAETAEHSTPVGIEDGTLERALRLHGLGDPTPVDARRDTRPNHHQIPGRRDYSSAIPGTQRPLVEKRPQINSRARSTRYLRMTGQNRSIAEKRTPQAAVFGFAATARLIDWNGRRGSYCIQKPGQERQLIYPAGASLFMSLTAQSPADENTGLTSPAYGADQIQILEGLEAVRKRPSMYIGSTGPRGLHHLVYEIVDNSVDEALAGYCDTISIVMLRDGGIRVVDNGRGIPVGLNKHENKSTVEVVLTILHAGGKFGGGGYAVSGGLHGVGISVVNALSSRLDVEVRRNGFVWRQTYKHGVPQAPLAKDEADSGTGTIITFWPSAETFESIQFDYETLRARFQQMAFLNKGLTITLTDERGLDGDTEPVEVVYLYEKGLVDYVEYLNSAKKIEVVHPEIISFEAEDTERKISRRGRDAVDELLPGERAHLREHDQHARGRHPRRGFPCGADHAGEQVRAGKGHPQGEGRQPHRRRRARGPDRGDLGEARRAAVRGPDQDEARQHRGEVVRAADHRRPA